MALLYKNTLINFSTQKLTANNRIFIRNMMRQALTYIAPYVVNRSRSVLGSTTIQTREASYNGYHEDKNGLYNTRQRKRDGTITQEEKSSLDNIDLIQKQAAGHPLIGREIYTSNSEKLIEISANLTHDKDSTNGKVSVELSNPKAPEEQYARLFDKIRTVIPEHVTKWKEIASDGTPQEKTLTEVVEKIKNSPNSQEHLNNSDTI